MVSYFSVCLAGQSTYEQRITSSHHMSPWHLSTSQPDGEVAGTYYVMYLHDVVAPCYVTIML